MKITQTASSQRAYCKRSAMSASIAAMVTFCITVFAFGSEGFPPHIQLLTAASMAIPCVLMAAYFFKKSLLPDETLLINRTEIEISDKDLFVRKFKNNIIKNEKAHSLAKFSGIRKTGPYVLIKFGLLNQVTVVSTQYLESEIEAMCKQLDILRTGKQANA